MLPVLSMLADPQPWRVPWALDRGSAAEFVAHLVASGARTVVEAGSGSSTVLLGHWAAATGARVITLEHDPRWHAETTERLEVAGVTGYVDLRFAPLRQTPLGPWYDTTVPDGVDAVLVDGPPERAGGRAAALPSLLDHLAPGWRLYLHDAGRDGEQAALAAWQRDHQVAVSVRQQLAQVTAGPVAYPHVDASDVAVTVLTGARPHLLARTLDALDASAPGLLGSAHVTVLHHSGDPGTSDVLARWGHVVDEAILRDEPPLIGRAWGDLMRRAVGSGRPLVLHLEDDWEVVSHAAGWLDQARRVLDTRADVSQVKLRHCREWTRPRHMVTESPIEWAPDPDRWCTAGDVHWTFNPTFARTRDVARVLAAGGGDRERDVQRVADRLGLRTCAQAYPGVFAHIGGVTGGPDSVRHRTACADPGRRR